MPNLQDKILNPEYPIVIAQYKRDDHGVGSEEHLHWALVVLSRKTAPYPGHAYQALDRHYSDGRGVVWEPHYAKTSLGPIAACLGAVQIGGVKARRFDDVDAVIRSHPTVPKPDVPGWNCRSWVLEVVELLRAQGWIDETAFPVDVATRTADAQPWLLKSLRVVSVQTEAGRRETPNGGLAVRWA